MRGGESWEGAVEGAEEGAGDMQEAEEGASGAQEKADTDSMDVDAQSGGAQPPAPVEQDETEEVQLPGTDEAAAAAAAVGDESMGLPEAEAGASAAGSEES